MSKIKIHLMYHGSPWRLIKRIEKGFRPIAKRLALGAMLPFAEPVTAVAGQVIDQYRDISRHATDIHSLKAFLPAEIQNYPIDDRIKDFVAGREQDGTLMSKDKRYAELLAVASLSWVAITGAYNPLFGIGTAVYFTLTSFSDPIR